MSEWVAEEGAITTLIALGGLQVGDEVQLDAMGEYSHQKPYPYSIHGVIETIDHPPLRNGCVWQGHQRERLATAVVGLGSRWYLCRENIIAWRRP